MSTKYSMNEELSIFKPTKEEEEEEDNTLIPFGLSFCSIHIFHYLSK